MQIHALTTGAVKITQNWMIGRASGAGRLINALLDRRYTDWLPIYCYVIEHPEGLIVRASADIAQGVASRTGAGWTVSRLSQLPLAAVALTHPGGFYGVRRERVSAASHLDPRWRRAAHPHARPQPRPHVGAARRGRSSCPVCGRCLLHASPADRYDDRWSRGGSTGASGQPARHSPPCERNANCVSAKPRVGRRASPARSRAALRRRCYCMIAVFQLLWRLCRQSSWRGSILWRDCVPPNLPKAKVLKTHLCFPLAWIFALLQASCYARCSTSNAIKSPGFSINGEWPQSSSTTSR